MLTLADARSSAVPSDTAFYRRGTARERQHYSGTMRLLSIIE